MGDVQVAYYSKVERKVKGKQMARKPERNHEAYKE